MSEITGPITIELDTSDIENLKAGETIKHELDTDIDGTTNLEIVWKTVYHSEGAKELHSELTEIFNDEA
jgi:hypothetical protein